MFTIHIILRNSDVERDLAKQGDESSALSASRFCHVSGLRQAATLVHRSSLVNQLSYIAGAHAVNGHRLRGSQFV